MKRTLSTALCFSFFASASALAADGYVTGDVNLRAGPDPSYPSVATLSDGTSVAIEGCVDNWSWCDVASGNDRGWVAGNFLQEVYQGQRVLVPEYGVQIGIPIVSFVFGTYWDSHYRNRPWYNDRARWGQVKPQYRPIAAPHRPPGNPHNDSHDNTHGDAHAAQAPNHPTGEDSRQHTVAPAQPAHRDTTPNPGVQPHPVAAPARPAEKYSDQPKPAPHNPAGPKEAAVPKVAPQPPRVMPQPKVAPQQPRAAESKEQRKEPPAKPAPEHEDNGKDKEH